MKPSTLAFILFSPTLLFAEKFPMTMELDWKPNVQFAGILLAQEKGWYDEAGLEVTIPKFDTEKDIVARVAASDNTIGSSESGVLLRERHKGAKIKAIGTMFQGSPLSFISLKTSNLTKVADLNGKKIGLHSDTPKVLEVIFNYNKITDYQVYPVIVGYQMEELKTGKVDAAQGYLIDEAVMLQTQGVEINVIPVVENGYSAYSQTFFVSEDFIAKHPGQIKKFLEVTFRGWREAFAHPEATAKLVIEKFYPEGTLAYQTESLRKIEKLMTLENPEIGQMRRETWQASIDMFLLYKIGETPKTADEILDFQFLNAIYP